jgi:hypothetical protein
MFASSLKSSRNIQLSTSVHQEYQFTPAEENEQVAGNTQFNF